MGDPCTSPESILRRKPSAAVFGHVPDAENVPALFVVIGVEKTWRSCGVPPSAGGLPRPKAGGPLEGRGSAGRPGVRWKAGGPLDGIIMYFYSKSICN